MSSAQQEGVIKFDLAYQPGPAQPAVLIEDLETWRARFRELGLLGQDPGRYGGFGFGNLSRRLPEHPGNAFLISGTQTGGLPVLTPEHYVAVLDCDPVVNRVVAVGPIKPSSESLSHGVLYNADPDIAWVMHLHSPDIFRHRQQLGLPCTDPGAAYGTPEMAGELRRLALDLATGAPHLVVMTGHEDGILAFGPEADATGEIVLETLRRSHG